MKTSAPAYVRHIEGQKIVFGTMCITSRRRQRFESPKLRIKWYVTLSVAAE